MYADTVILCYQTMSVVCNIEGSVWGSVTRNMGIIGREATVNTIDMDSDIVIHVINKPDNNCCVLYGRVRPGQCAEKHVDDWKKSDGKYH